MKGTPISHRRPGTGHITVNRLTLGRPRKPVPVETLSQTMSQQQFPGGSMPAYGQPMGGMAGLPMGGQFYNTVQVIFPNMAHALPRRGRGSGHVLMHSFFPGPCFHAYLISPMFPLLDRLSGVDPLILLSAIFVPTFLLPSSHMFVRSSKPMATSSTSTLCPARPCTSPSPSRFPASPPSWRTR